MSLINSVSGGLLLARIFGMVQAGSAWHLVKAIAMFLALKTVLTILITVVLAIVLHNFLVGFMTDLIQAATDSANLDAGGVIANPVILQLTGLAGWAGELLKLPQAFAIQSAAFSVAAVRAWVPFLR